MEKFSQLTGKTNESTEEILHERKVLVQRVLDAILESERGKSTFKEELIQLLEKCGF